MKLKQILAENQEQPVIDKFDGEYAFLSNFFPAPVAWEGITYQTSEHAFQAAKTLNIDERKAIAALSTPGKAKRAGKKVQLRPNWDSIRVDIMLEIVEAKFKQNPELMDQLIATGDVELIEGNSWNDTFWGMCRGKGKNYLGKILMIIRNEENEHRQQ